MSRLTRQPSSDNVFASLGIPEPDVELAKAALAIRIHRLAEHRCLTPEEAAQLLNVPTSDLPALFQGRLATCSLEQLLRFLMRLGDDVEILVRPILGRNKRGSLHVRLTANIDDVTPLAPMAARPGASIGTTVTETRARPSTPIDDRSLIDKHAVEKFTSLDITTIYRKMAAATFPQPVKVGRRRVAWRLSDVVQWQKGLQVGTATVRRKASASADGNPIPGGRGRRGRI